MSINANNIKKGVEAAKSLNKSSSGTFKEEGNALKDKLKKAKTRAATSKFFGYDKEAFKAQRDQKKAEADKKLQQNKNRNAQRKIDRENNKKQREDDLAAAKEIKQNTDKEQKAKGTGKLQQLTLSEIKKLIKIMLPVLKTMAVQYAVGSLKCPSAEKVNKDLEKLNNMIRDLNKTSKKIDNITKKTQAPLAAVNTAMNIAKTFKTIIPILSAAAKPIPLIPGAVVSAIDDVDFFANKILYNADGTARLAPIINGINGLVTAVSVFSLILKQIAGIIAQIIPLLQACLAENNQAFIPPQDRKIAYLPPPEDDGEEIGEGFNLDNLDALFEGDENGNEDTENEDTENETNDENEDGNEDDNENDGGGGIGNEGGGTNKSLNQLLNTSDSSLSNINGQSIVPFSNITKQYIEYGNSNYNDFQNTSYNGFDIKIVEVPFSSTAIRKKAVGYSQSGIALIETGLSFTTNNQTLVSELKLIIDQNNLKAY